MQCALLHALLIICTTTQNHVHAPDVLRRRPTPPQPPEPNASEDSKLCPPPPMNVIANHAHAATRPTQPRREPGDSPLVPSRGHAARLLAVGLDLARLVRGDLARAAAHARLDARLVRGRRRRRAERDAGREHATGAARRRGRRRGRGRRRRRVGGVELAPLDVRVEHVRVRVLGLDQLGVARRLRARAARSALLARRHRVRVSRVEPDHADVVVVPHREREHHAARHRLAHLLDAALDLEVVDVGEVVLLRVAHLVGDRRVRL
mmetsp:Transcript_62772/g.166856  ORF Transcript_62772/g.166856 Transcript_62772/m.166856 type:complete len:264 (-) Transcript_62772:1081-1872(-)